MHASAAAGKLKTNQTSDTMTPYVTPAVRMWVDQTLESASGSLRQLLSCVHQSIDEVNKLGLCLLQSFLFNAYVFRLY